MRIYAVYLPSDLSPLRALEEAALVRQGFNWQAFLITPVWALWLGLWLALALWLGWILAVASIVSVAHLDPVASLALYGLGALAFGLEADFFRQARLARTDYLLDGLTVGESLQEAETLYFGRRDLSDTPAPSAATKSGATGGGVKSFGTTFGADLLGLFPPQEHKH